MSGLVVSNLSKSFGGLKVLDGLSLRVVPGEFVALLGPSGAGKSTLFHILTGGVEPDAGTVTFAGQPLAQAGRPFAFMPQRDALMPWRRIIDNTTLGLEVAGMPRSEARKKVTPLFDTFGLSGFEQAYPNALSGGMRQRAAFLRTMVMDKPMLLLDEPFGALDALTRAEMQLWLSDLWQTEKRTALLITHDVREAVLLADRIYLLSPRPARVVREIKIDIPRPRGLASLASDIARNAEAEIFKTLLTPERTL